MATPRPTSTKCSRGDHQDTVLFHRALGARCLTRDGAYSEVCPVQWLASCSIRPKLLALSICRSMAEETKIKRVLTQKITPSPNCSFTGVVYTTGVCSGANGHRLSKPKANIACPGTPKHAPPGPHRLHFLILVQMPAAPSR